jgi:hypothetical protein
LEHGEKEIPMTPRSLLTAIGATAVAFAIAIGVAAGVSGVTTEEATSVASTTTDAQVLAYGWPGFGPAAGETAASWTGPCVVAV